MTEPESPRGERARSAAGLVGEIDLRLAPMFDGPAVGAVEAGVLPGAGRQAVGRLRASLVRAVLAVDPAAAEVRHERAVAEREVTVRPLPDGMAELSAQLRYRVVR